MAEHKCGNILIVDDNEDLLIALRILLNGTFSRIDTLNPTCFYFPLKTAQNCPHFENPNFANARYLVC